MCHIWVVRFELRLREERECDVWHTFAAIAPADWEYPDCYRVLRVTAAAAPARRATKWARSAGQTTETCFPLLNTCMRLFCLFMHYFHLSENLQESQAMPFQRNSIYVETFVYWDTNISTIWIYIFMRFCDSRALTCVQVSMAKYYIPGYETYRMLHLYTKHAIYMKRSPVWQSVWPVLHYTRWNTELDFMCSLLQAQSYWCRTTVVMQLWGWGAVAQILLDHILLCITTVYSLKILEIFQWLNVVHYFHVYVCVSECGHVLHAMYLRNCSSLQE